MAIQSNPIFMKALSLSGFLISLLSLAAGLYNQFVCVPRVKALEDKLDDVSLRLWHEAHDMKIMIGEIIIIAGAIGFVLCLIPAIKQKKALAFVGILVALGAILLGLMQGTHMFS